MERSTVARTIDKMYEARLANDSNACSALFSDNASMHLAGEGDDVYNSKTQIPQQVDQQIEALVAAWEWHSMEVIRQTVEGNSAAVMYRLKTTFRPTGDHIETLISDHFVIDENGRISEFVEFVDTALVQSLVKKVM